MAPLKLIHVAETNTVTRVDAPSSVPFTGGVIPIVVTGEPGTRYIINVDKKESLTSGVTKAVTVREGVLDFPNYNFSREIFTSFIGEAGEATLGIKEKQVGNGFELDSTGRKTHALKLGRTSSSRRLDVTLEPVTKQGATSKLSSFAPNKAGVVSIVQVGVNTLTITPITYDNAANFGTLPTNITVSRPERFVGDPYTTASQRYVTYRGGTSSVSSTRLVLQTDNSNITQGMLVSGSGIPHNTTVASVTFASLTLSAAATIVDGTSIRFDRVDANIIPFSFTITPAVGKVLSVLDYTASGSYNRPLIVGGTNINMLRRQHGTTSDSATMDLIAEIAPYSGQGVLSVMSIQPSTTEAHGTRNIVPGMLVYNEDGTRLTTDAGVGVTVASVTDHDTLVLSAAVTIAAGILVFKPRNPDLSVFGLNIDKVGNDVVISGYLKVKIIKNTGIIPVYLDSAIQVHN